MGGGQWRLAIPSDAKSTGAPRAGHLVENATERPHVAPVPVGLALANLASPQGNKLIPLRRVQFWLGSARFDTATQTDMGKTDLANP